MKNYSILTDTYKQQFNTARATLRSAGMKVIRTAYDHSQYQVVEPGPKGKTSIVSQSDIIEWAEKLQVKAEAGL